MIELAILGLTLAILAVREVLWQIGWKGNDWRHLRLDDGWDAGKSRGRIRDI